MKKIKSLLVFGAMAMASSMAWGQTVVATMQNLIDGATVKTATESTDWETDVTGGAVYKFTRTAENTGTYLGGITNDAVTNALKGSKVVTIAAWVYGCPNGCIFSLGEQNTGVKFMLTATTDGAKYKTTTKGVADFDELSFTMPANQWNLVAFSVYGKASGTSSYRYYQGTTGNNYYTRTNKSMSTMNDASLLAIGSGNQNGPREIFSSELANLTVIESDGYLGNAKIAELVGAAPTIIGEPYVFTTEIKNKNTYALVNVQPEGSHNWYLKNVDGVLTPADASACNAATEWEEDAQFVAEVQSDGRVAFKNVANGQYFAWKGTGTASNNTVGVNNNSGFDTVLGDHTLWTLHNDTRFEDTYYLVANKRAPEGTAYNKAGSPIIANNGAWNAWGDSNCTLAGYSTSFGFVLVKEYVEPIFTTDKLYTLKNEKDNRGYLAMNPEIDYVGLADVTLGTYGALHASSLNNGVSIAWQLEENGEGQVALRNVINGKYLGKGDVKDDQGGVWSDTPLYFTYEAAEDAGAYHLKVDGKYLCPACGWKANEGAVRFVAGHENAVDLVIAETESVPVHVGEAGYATLYVDKDVAAPFGVTAYLLSDCGTYLAAKDAPSFRSETGVVLAAAEGDYLFPVVPNAGVNNSDLTGTLVEMAAPENCFTLAVEDGEVGFYSFTGTLAANKAYYVAPAGESNLRISFDELTSIISAAQQNGGQAIFDLQGRRVVNAQNGLYIVNGKKVIR